MNSQSKRPSGSTSHTKDSNRAQLVRQDRIDTISELCTVRVNNKSFELVNYSAFGFAIFTEQPFNELQETFPVELQIGNTTLTSTSAKAVRVLSTDSGYVVGFEIVGPSIDRERFESVIEAKHIIEGLDERLRLSSRIPEPFRHLTFELRHLLQILQEEIETRKSAHNFTSSNELTIWEDSVADEVSKFLQSSLSTMYANMKSSLSSLDNESKKTAYEFFRSLLKDLIYQSPFTHRTYNKPLGYAGDYEMMNIIYRNENFSGSTFGKCLQRYFLEYKESKAVRNRATYLLEKIVTFCRNRDLHRDGVTRILSVASGPAMELQLLIEKMRGFDFSKTEFYLLDQDAVSLKHAQYRIRELSRINGVNPKVHYIHKSMKHVITGALAESKFDLIYSAGLFDYFSDPVAQMAATSLYKSLSPRGQMIIGNFDVSSPNQFVMELAVDWNLIYRSSEDLRALFGSITPQLSVESESEGVNLFSVMSKP